MQTGKVKSFNAQKGFGIIQPEDGSEDIFVPMGALERAGIKALVEGQKVNYELLVDRRSGRFSVDQLQLVA
ncbi:MAG: cold-shock protein [Methylocystis sp.]|uniref:cold-shock protein n=1 Tax=Methylocystis sp. TaxID=1911079 RepID=UPI003D0A9DFA